MQKKKGNEMRMLYRQITPESPLYPKCVKLRREFLWKPYRIITSAQFDKEEQQSSIFIATPNGRTVVGCVLLLPEPENKWLRVRQLVVDNEYRNQGIGTALLSYAETQAMEMKLNQLALYAHEECFSFFEKRDYKAITGWYTHLNGMHTILMRRILAEDTKMW